MNCLYCGLETGTSGSHTSTPGCLAALREERERLKREVLQRSLALMAVAADASERALSEPAELGRSTADAPEVQMDPT